MQIHDGKVKPDNSIWTSEDLDPEMYWADYYLTKACHRILTSFKQCSYRVDLFDGSTVVNGEHSTNTILSLSNVKSGELAIFDVVGVMNGAHFPNVGNTVSIGSHAKRQNELVAQSSIRVSCTSF